MAVFHSRARTFRLGLALVPFSAPAFAGVADTAWLAARSGLAAPGAPGYSFNGLFSDNASAPLPAPMLSGNMLLVTAALRQGASAPSDDRGMWLLSAGGQMRLVARQGQVAPGTESGTTFQLLSTTSVDSSGRALMVATLTGPSIVAGLNSRGVWQADLGSTSMTLREGQVAPETAPVGYFRSFSEGLGLDGSAGSDIGIRAIVSSLPGEPTILPITYGAWARTAQGFQMLYWSYGTAPGIPSAFLREAEASISASGMGAYFGRVEGSGVTSVVVNGVVVTSDHCIWRTNPGQQILIARTGDAAPGLPTGTVFWTLTSSTVRPAVNSNGDVVFSGTLAGTSITSANRTGLWCSTSEGTSLLARAGSPATAAGSGVVFDGLTVSSTDGSLAVMENGDAVFWTSFAGTGVTLSNCRGIWKRSPAGQDTVIARAGVSNSALPSGTTLVRTTLPRAMKAAGNDHVMFTAQLSGTGVTTSNDDVLLRHTASGGLMLVAREGSTIGNHVLRSFVNNGADMQITGTGFALVPVMLSPASNPNGTPVLGALGISPSGVARVLAAQNHPIALSDGSFPTVGQLRIAGKSAIADDGRVAFAATFGSGTPRDEGVFVVNIDSGYTPPAPCPADFNASGSLTTEDIFAFLSAWFSGDADYDHSGTTEVVDIFQFLSDWYHGCP